MQPLGMAVQMGVAQDQIGPLPSHDLQDGFGIFQAAGRKHPVPLGEQGQGQHLTQCGLIFHQKDFDGTIHSAENYNHGLLFAI